MAITAHVRGQKKVHVGGGQMWIARDTHSDWPLIIIWIEVTYSKAGKLHRQIRHTLVLCNYYTKTYNEIAIKFLAYFRIVRT